MDNTNVGPRWVLKIIHILAVIGFYTVLIAIVTGIAWLIKHVKIVIE